MEVNYKHLQLQVGVIYTLPSVSFLCNILQVWRKDALKNKLYTCTLETVVLNWCRDEEHVSLCFTK
jgi:hypothetical protein